jgi:hypothetical protein
MTALTSKTIRFDCTYTVAPKHRIVKKFNERQRGAG